MKFTRSQVRCKTPALPVLRFEEQSLTSFSGLIVFQNLFLELNLKSRIGQCFSHLCRTPIFSDCSLVLLLVVHLLLGYRRLKHMKYYRDDPMVLRLLGLSILPDASTLSRRLARVDDRSITKLGLLNQSLVLDRLAESKFSRVTLDFDGTVISTTRHAEGVALGWNRKKRGLRSYYPLLCSVAQTSQILQALHRSGNVHDSNGAKEFMLDCIALVQKALPKATIEARFDSAFFSQETVNALEEAGVLYSISVPVNRYKVISNLIDDRCRWKTLNEDSSYFESQHQMDSWKIGTRRFIFVRQSILVQTTGPLQLDLFEPRDVRYQYKVILTNKPTGAASAVSFHDGRGSQEGIFAELKSQLPLGYVPNNTWNANKTYLLCVFMAHNLGRELQMRHGVAQKRSGKKRPAHWRFVQLETLRKTVIQHAGRLIRPQGKLTLSMSVNTAVRNQLCTYLGVGAVSTAAGF